MKRTALLLSLVFLFNIPAVSALAAVELPIKAESAVLLDAYSGKVLYEKEPHKKLYPASMTKLMTLVLAMDALREGKVKMTDILTASPNAASYRGSRIFLTAGEKLLFKDMLLGVALASGNDASVAVAEHIAGSHEAFVDLMNKKAAELGMLDTHFANCNGLHDPNHYTSAYDFAQLGLYALKYPELLAMTSTKHYRIRENTKKPFQYDNTNKLLWFYKGVDGFKTGWTADAKYCFTGTVERNGMRLVSTVMGVTEKGGHFADTKTLYNWGFSQYAFKEFYKPTDVVDTVKVGKGQAENVNVVPEKKVGITLPKGKEKSVSIAAQTVNAVNAPVVKGQTLGAVTVTQDGQIMETVNLVAAEDVRKNSWWQMYKKVLKATLTACL